MVKKIAYIPISKPGGGKGTLLEYLKSLFPPDEVFTSDTGQLIRNSLGNVPESVFLNQYHKDLFQQINNSGRLQTSATATLHWCQHLRMNYNGQRVMIIDGSPRRKYELFQLYEDLQESYDTEVRFIYINVRDEVAIKHMQERHLTHPRPETATIEAIQTRLVEFDEKIRPTINLIRVMPGVNFKQIDNNGTLEEFRASIRTIV